MAGEIQIQGTEEGMKPWQVLFVVGGLLAILPGAMVLAIQAFQGLPFLPEPGVYVILAVDIIGGLVLWIAFLKAETSVLVGGKIAAGVSLILMVFGGTAGFIGGLVGIAGGVWAIVLPYLPINA